MIRVKTGTLYVFLNISKYVSLKGSPGGWRNCYSCKTVENISHLYKSNNISS